MDSIPACKYSVTSVLLALAEWRRKRKEVRIEGKYMRDVFQNRLYVYGGVNVRIEVYRGRNDIWKLLSGK